MKGLLKDKKVVISIIVVILVLSLVVYGNLIKEDSPINNQLIPENQKIQKQLINDTIQTPQSYSTSISFQIENIQIPTSLPIYKTTYSLLTDSDASALAKKLGFISEPITPSIPVTPRYIMYSERGSDLTIYPELQTIDFKTGINSTSTFTTLLEQEKIKDSVFAFLTSRGITSSTNDLYLNEITYVNLDPAGHFNEGSDKNHNGAIVTVTKKIEEKYPLLSSSKEGIYNVIINSKYEIISVKILPNPNYIEYQNLPLKTTQEIRAGVSKAVLTSIGNNKYEPFESFQLGITSIKLTSVEIAYMNNSSSVESNLIYPIFVFKGVATLTDRKEEPVVMVLDAIPARYFNQ